MRTKVGISIAVLGLIIFGVLFYVFNFALSFKVPFVVVYALSLVLFVAWGLFSKESGFSSNLFACQIGLILTLLLVFSVVLANSTVFNSRAYSGLFSYEERPFTEYSASLEDIPLLDRVSSDNIAKRRFGELTDYVSQYKIVDSEQIIYKGKPTRVSILEHTGFWSWKRNKTSPGYILVDMQTQKAELVRTDKPIVYSEKTYFGNNIKRHIRLQYKTVLFFNPSVELNDDGEVYWVAATYKRVVGPFGGRLIDGVITVNAHTGELHHYTDLTDIPEWIDNVYPSDYIMQQYDYKGKLSGGYWNTWFSKTGMTMTTDGYNYLPIGNDNWIYTGITSVSMADESNIAFILTNKRTMKTYYYSISGAEEFSAMDAAEGEVQHLGYKSTFPLLLNIDDIPTYVLSLKDKNELVKMYAMIQVEDYRNVIVDTDLTALKRKYVNKLNGTENTGSSEAVTPSKVQGVLSARDVINISGNSYIVFKLKDDTVIYQTLAVDNLDLLFAKLGEQIEVEAIKVGE